MRFFYCKLQAKAVLALHVYGRQYLHAGTAAVCEPALSLSRAHTVYLTLWFLWITSPFLSFLQWNENLESHHKWITSFSLATVALCEYLCQIVEDSCNRIKSLTFLISNAKISHDRGLISFRWKYPFLWINSHVRSSCNEMIICNYITNESFNFV